MDYVWVGLGGFLGANARYALGVWLVGRWGMAFPWSTLLINVTGSLAIGLILTVLTEKLVVDPAWRLLLVVGFLGGYTTFSSYTFEALTLGAEGEWLHAPEERALIKFLDKYFPERRKKRRVEDDSKAA